jgi:hypothetical protein
MTVIRVLFLFGTILWSLSSKAFTPHELWQTWPDARFETTTAPCLGHSLLMQRMQALEAWYPEDIKLEELGMSYLGRPIKMLTIGTGDKKILLWSQMHGNEPSATPALLDIANFLLEHAGEPVAKSILEQYTLLMIPMLNPDGTEIYKRRNAQGIDINRDALQLATPEGRILKRIRDEHEPMLGFNLHDQDRRISVGTTGVLATNAVLAVAGDVANTVTPGRERTKRASAAIVEALAPFMPGGMARYDEDWSPRAFGDNITAWGTPVVLIESGGLPPGRDFSVLTRLNFVAILSVLAGLAHDDLASYDPQVYENLPRNEPDKWSDVVVRGAHIRQPGSNESFRADLAFDVLRSDRQIAGCSDDTYVPSRIFMIGDASLHGAGINIDASDSLLLAPFDVGVRGWSKRHWFANDGLSRFAGLGVGTIYWAVGKRHNAEAKVFARQLRKQGLPRIEVLTKPLRFPEAVLSEQPSQAAPVGLGGVLVRLGVENPDRVDAIEQLWMKTAEDETGSPRLHKKLPASFLLVSPVNDGHLDINTARLSSVWLDGQQVDSSSDSAK